MGDSYEARRRFLWHALRTRALTDEELSEVWSMGNGINIEMMVSYSPEEKLRELHNALLIQQMLRASKDK